MGKEPECCLEASVALMWIFRNSDWWTCGFPLGVAHVDLGGSKW